MSLRYAQASWPLSLADSIRLIRTAARSGQQPGGWDPFVDDLRRHARRQHGLATGAGVLAADEPMHKELGRFAIELLADFLANALQRMTLIALRRSDLVAVFDALNFLEALSRRSHRLR